MSSDPFADLAGSLEKFISALRQLISRATPSPGSPGSEEAEGSSYPGDWGEHPSRDVLAGGLLLLVWSCCDHLSGAATLLRDRSHIPSLYTLIRAAAEAAANAYYLSDTDIDPLERVRRYMNWRLNALSEETRMIRPISVPGGASEPSVTEQAAAEVAEMQRQIQAIGHTGQRYGLSYRAQKGSTPAHLGSEPPKIMSLVDRCASETAGLGTLQYRQLSSVAHAQLHGLKRFLSRSGMIASDTPGQVFTNLEVRADSLALHLMAGPLCATSMADRLCRFAGWDMDEVRPSITQVLTVWGRVAGTPYLGPQQGS